MKNLTSISLELRFPDKETAISVAESISGAKDLETFPPDGWIGPHYYNISVVNETGALFTMPEDDYYEDFVPELIPGYHMIGLWRGEIETIPQILVPYLVPEGTLGVEFG